MHLLGLHGFGFSYFLALVKLPLTEKGLMNNKRACEFPGLLTVLAKEKILKSAVVIPSVDFILFFIF